MEDEQNYITRCNNCYTTYRKEEDIPVKVTDEESYKVCELCQTDKYLMDIYPSEEALQEKLLSLTNEAAMKNQEPVDYQSEMIKEEIEDYVKENQLALTDMQITSAFVGVQSYLNSVISEAVAESIQYAITEG